MPRRLFIICLFFALTVVPISLKVSSVQAEPDLKIQSSNQEAGLLFWHDVAGDLWVKTPLYEWNITGGDQISVRGNGQRPWARTESRQRLLDHLFLFSSSAEANLSAKIIYSLPNEGLVAVERSSPAGLEYLWLGFRSYDGLITLSHGWEGEKPSISADSNDRASVISLAVQNTQAGLRYGVLSQAENALLPANYEYVAGYDYLTGFGLALLHQPGGSGENAALAIGFAADCYPGLGNLPPDSVPHCPPVDRDGDAAALERRYLLLFNAERHNPLRPLEDLSLRLQLALPDLNIGSIGRSPRFDYDQPQNQPSPGQTVTFSARVANRGGLETGPFVYTWMIDGEPFSTGSYPNLAPGELVELSVDWQWQTGPHTIALEVAGQELLAEVSQQNNRIVDRTDALALGLWVEQSVYDWFNQHQVGLGLGSVSWDDWAQRQVRVWNQMFAEAVHPLTPDGIVERVRLDKIVVVPDGSLPGEYPANYPAVSDKSVDLMWGFPCELVDGCSLRPGYGAYYPNSTEAVHVEYSLMHELSHARYLDDLYGLNVVAELAQLAEDVGPTDTTLRMMNTVEGSKPFQPPVYLAIGGELVLCMAASGSAFQDCQRGAEGTFPRPHLRGDQVNRATVRLQDGSGSLVMGSPALPLLGWSDHLYYNPYMLDVMSGGTIYQQHSAYALNRIAGRRPVCGNYNAPCNLGEYQNDIPAENILVLRRAGIPVEGAQVEVYQARSFPHIWYAKEFPNVPDAVHLSDSEGRVNLGASPFSSIETGVSAYNRVVLLKITYQGLSSYRFFDIVQANEAYWSGQVGRASYVYDIPLSENADLWIQPPAPISAPSGERVEIEVRIGNQGLFTATGVVLKLTLDPSLSVAASSVPYQNNSPTELAWLLPDLASLQSDTIRIVFTLPETSSGGPFTVRFEINSRSPDAALVNNAALVELRID